MKYPVNPVAAPLKGKEAERVRKAIKSGRAITNPAYERTIREIIEQGQGKNKLKHAKSKASLHKV